MRKSYFKKSDSDPAPLRVSAKRFVRFEDCDPMSIMWHGRYASFLEDAREIMGHTYGIGYLDFQRNGVALPVKNMFIDYLAPLRYRNQYSTVAILHWSEAPRLNIEYEIRDSENNVVTNGYSIQLMVNFAGELLFDSPEFYLQFREQWKQGNLKNPE